MDYRLKEYRYVFDNAECDCVTLGLPGLTQRGLLEKSMWLQVGSVTENRWWTRAAASFWCSHSLLQVHLCHQRTFSKSGSFLLFCYRKNLDGEGAKGSSAIKFPLLILFEKHNLSRWILQTCLFCLDKMEQELRRYKEKRVNRKNMGNWESCVARAIEKKNKRVSERKDDEQIPTVLLFLREKWLLPTRREREKWR